MSTTSRGEACGEASYATQSSPFADDDGSAITKIEVFVNKKVNRIGGVKLHRGSTSQAHGVEGGSCKFLELSTGEYITSITGTHAPADMGVGGLFKFIVTTSTGKEKDLGARGGCEEYDMAIPSGQKLCGLFGTSDSKMITTVGAVYTST